MQRANQDHENGFRGEAGQEDPNKSSYYELVGGAVRRPTEPISDWKRWKDPIPKTSRQKASWHGPGVWRISIGKEEKGHSAERTGTKMGAGDMVGNGLGERRAYCINHCGHHREN